MIVVLDFPGRRDQPPVSDLRLEDAGHRVRYLLAEEQPRETSGREYVYRLRDRLGAEASSVTAVVAYCLAAPIGVEFAAAVDSPRLALINATLGGPDAVDAALAEALDQLGRGDDTTVADLRRQSPEDRNDFLVERAHAVLGGTSDDELLSAVAHDLAGRHIGWISHVMAASSLTADHPHAWHLVSADHDLARHWPLPSGRHPARVADPVASLTSSPAARDHVLGWLDAATPLAAGA
ncbi:hypothetical protein [Actinoplanes subglobosus]|uniref:Uncharacterized protein n=1 Tax=Actinoplanes subglobosus TaxID=1547892 RepID=A0ABV8IQH4_9ACTN